jgi:hypothetical protein
MRYFYCFSSSSGSSVQDRLVDCVLSNRGFISSQQEECLYYIPNDVMTKLFEIDSSLTRLDHLDRFEV